MSSRTIFSSNGCPTLVRTTERIRSLGTCALPETSTLTTMGAGCAGCGVGAAPRTGGGGSRESSAASMARFRHARPSREFKAPCLWGRPGCYPPPGLSHMKSGSLVRRAQTKTRDEDAGSSSVLKQFLERERKAAGPAARMRQERALIGGLRRIHVTGAREVSDALRTERLKKRELCRRRRVGFDSEADRLAVRVGKTLRVDQVGLLAQDFASRHTDAATVGDVEGEAGEAEGAPDLRLDRREQVARELGVENPECFLSDGELARPTLLNQDAGRNGGLSRNRGRKKIGRADRRRVEE